MMMMIQYCRLKTCQPETEGLQDQDEWSISMTVPDAVCGGPRSVHDPVAVSAVRRDHYHPNESKFGVYCYQ